MNKFIIDPTKHDFEFDLDNVIKVCNCNKNHTYTTFWYPNYTGKYYNTLYFNSLRYKMYEMEIALIGDYDDNGPAFHISLCTLYIDETGIGSGSGADPIIISALSSPTLDRDFYGYLDINRNIPCEFDAKMLPHINRLADKMVKYLREHF